MAYFTYDTSVIISRKITGLFTMPGNFLLSSIVLMELTAGAADGTERKVYETLFRAYRKEQRLMVPNDEDWLLTSKILFLLTHSRRRLHHGKLKRLPPGASQRLALDVLIAVSARRWKRRSSPRTGRTSRASSATATRLSSGLRSSSGVNSS